MKRILLGLGLLPVVTLGVLLVSPSPLSATHVENRTRCLQYDGEPRTLDNCIRFARKAHPSSSTPSGGGETLDGTDIPKVKPLDNATIPDIAVTAINFLLVVAGALSVIFLIVGGIRYIISSGSPDAIDRAKKTVLYAVVGILVVILSYAIVNILTSI